MSMRNYREIYKDYTIVFNPKPIPDRNHDYDYFPHDYDGPEDSRGGDAASVTQAQIAIDEEIGELSGEEHEHTWRDPEGNEPKDTQVCVYCRALRSEQD